jgi:ABC-type antimicrobial peptide transport system permease subunit
MDGWLVGWLVETVFSCLKRTLDDEYVYSVRLKNMIREIILKASLYNKMISIETKKVVKSEILIIMRQSSYLSLFPL